MGEDAMDAATGHRLEPCGFMRRWISGLVDGSLAGLARRYAEAHIARCARCRAALEALRAMRERLRSLTTKPSEEDAMPPSRAEALQRELDRIDEGRAGP
jgi:anti-sigma factor RsiW